MNRVTDPRGRSLEVVAPSQAQPGAPFTVTVVAFLDNGRTDWHYGGSLEIRCDDPAAAGTGTAHAIAVGGGAFKHTMRLSTPGVHRIAVRDMESNLEARSNPVMVSGGDANTHTDDGLGLYWGDLHNHVGERYRHRGISDAYAPLDYSYHFGRHVAALDFMAISDHDQLSTWRPGIIPIWDRFMRAAAYFNRPGEFVTLLGWEWTNGVNLTPGRPQYGQKCVYFRGAEGPIFSAADPGSDTPDKLYDKLRGHRCFLIPHHVSAPINFYNDWDYHDAGLERLVEVYSVWGCGERAAAAGNPYPIRSMGSGDVAGHHVSDGLARGYTLGFTAGGDTHDAAPGLGHHFNGHIGEFERTRWAKAEPYHAGIQGVWAEELTREAIFEAIHARRTYGTTGARIIVRTELAGTPMGHVFPLRPPAPWTYRVQVEATADISSVEVVCNGQTVAQHAPGTTRCEIEHVVEAAPGPTYVYARIIQADGHVAWASPHFLPAGSNDTTGRA